MYLLVRIKFVELTDTTNSPEEDDSKVSGKHSHLTRSGQVEWVRRSEQPPVLVQGYVPSGYVVRVEGGGSRFEDTRREKGVSHGRKTSRQSSRG